MANTEIVALLKIIREAEYFVADELLKSGLTHRKRDILEDFAEILSDLDNALVISKLNDCLEDLRSNSGKLKNLNRRIKRKIEGLGKIAGHVDKVAKGTDAIVKATTILISAGLV